MNLPSKEGILKSVSAMLSAASFDGAQMRILGQSAFLIQLATIVANTVVFPVPGGPWMIVKSYCRAILTAIFWLSESSIVRVSMTKVSFIDIGTDLPLMIIYLMKPVDLFVAY